MKVTLENSLVIRAAEQAFSSLSSMLFIYSCSRVMSSEIFSEFSYYLVIYFLLGIIVNNSVVYPLQARKNISLEQIESILSILLIFLVAGAMIFAFFSEALSSRAFFYSAMLAGLNSVRILWFIFGNNLRQIIIIAIHLLAMTFSVMSIVYTNQLFLFFVTITYCSFLVVFCLKYIFLKWNFKGLFSIMNAGKFMLLASLIEWFSANQILIWITSKHKMTLIAGEYRIGQLYYGFVVVMLVFFDSLFTKLLLSESVQKARSYLMLGILFISLNSLVLLMGYSKIQLITKLNIDKNVLLLLGPYYLLSIIYLYFKVYLRTNEDYKTIFILQLIAVILIQGVFILDVVPIVRYIFYYCLISLNLFMTFTHGVISWRRKF